MNNQIAFEELMKVITHIQEDEMRLERIARCLKLDIEHKLLIEDIENNHSQETNSAKSEITAVHEKSPDTNNSTKQELNKEILEDYDGISERQASRKLNKKLFVKSVKEVKA